MARRIVTAREQVEMLGPWLRHAADERHPDHGWHERTFGCAHTHGGRVLPQFRTAAAFDDQQGWRNSSSVAPSPLAIQGARGYHSL
jgi:hypothetical protein